MKKKGRLVGVLFYFLLCFCSRWYSFSWFVFLVFVFGCFEGIEQVFVSCTVNSGMLSIRRDLRRRRKNIRSHSFIIEQQILSF